MAGPPTYNLGISGGSLFHETIVALGTVKGDFLGFFFSLHQATTESAHLNRIL